MLILTRRVSEILKIGDDVDIAILGVKGSQVRIGINAPKDVAVHREEIWLKIQEEKKAQKKKTTIKKGHLLSDLKALMED